MKTIYTLFFAAIICLASNAKLHAQSDNIGAKSVVKIVTTHKATENGKAVKKLNTATAWCWKEPTLIVTALHAVAGADNIQVNKNNEKTTNAKVVSVLKEADLALLRINEDIGLTPLSLENADPNTKTEYAIWGYPHGVYSIQGDDIRFSRSLETNPTLNSILTGNELKHDLKVQGYPLPEARILRISSTIQPGHSGAPIFTSMGKVIGVADGGLRGGSARINWAMPAAFYVPRLLDSKDEKPVNTSMQVSLYSSSITVDADANDKEESEMIQKTTDNQKVKNGEQTIDQTWTTDYATIYKTLAQEDKKDLDTFLEESKINMSDTQYDVYEDFATGSALAFPTGYQLDVQNGWYCTSTSDASIIYYALPFNSGTYKNAVDNISVSTQSVTKLFTDDSPWVLPENSKDKWIADATKETAYYEAERSNGKKLISYTAEVKGPFLLVTVVVTDMSVLNSMDGIKELLHFSVAAQVTSFDEQ